MSSTCSARLHARRESSPAQVDGLQDAYRKELERRLRELRGVLRETIDENDALGISGGESARTQAEPRDDFDFEQNPAKQVAFRNQLQEWIDEGILEPASEEEIENGDHYTAFYVSAGYGAGTDFAGQQLRERGMDVPEVEAAEVIQRPIHVDELETIYTRNYEGLEDITEDIDQSLSQVLTTALRDGWGTRRTANEITKEVRTIQHSRARTLARTEMLNAHNSAALKRYERWDVEEAEILTHTPCEICQGIEANDPYPIAEAYGLVPAHPNCVCTVAPIV